MNSSRSIEPPTGSACSCILFKVESVANTGRTMPGFQVRERRRQFALCVGGSFAGAPRTVATYLQKLKIGLIKHLFLRIATACDLTYSEPSPTTTLRAATSPPQDTVNF